MDLEPDSLDVEYRNRLRLVDEELGSDDIKVIKFLCRKTIPDAKLERMKRGLDIFDELENCGKLSGSNYAFLGELLCRAGRYDLGREVGFSRQNFIEHERLHGSQLSRFRLLLFNVAEEIGKNDFLSLKFMALDYLGRKKADEVGDIFDLFTQLEKKSVLKDSDIGFLMENATSLDQSILKLLENYMGESSGRKGSHTFSHEGRVPDWTISQQMSVHPPPYAEISKPGYRSNADPLMNATDRMRQMTINDKLQKKVNTQKSSPKNLRKPVTSYNIMDDHLVSKDGSYNTGMTKHGNWSPISSLLPEQLCGPDTIGPPVYGPPIGGPQDAAFPAWTALRPHGLDSIPTYTRTADFSFGAKHQMAAGLAEDRYGHGGRYDPMTFTDYRSASPLAEDGELPRYKMTSNPRGLCIIINNDKFMKSTNSAQKELKPREGSEIDVENLRETFTYLKFKVLCYNNLGHHQMASLMDQYSNLDHSEFDCLVVCLLSHGTDKGIYGSDGKLVSIVDLQDPFKPLRCPTLKGKPKLFFIQACQGRSKQTGTDVEEDGDDLPISLHTIPHEADFMTGYATMHGFVSYRSRSQGSWYITKLTECLKRLADKEELMSILTNVNNEVGKAIALIEDGHLKQIPAPHTTLRKKLFFNPHI